MAEKISKAQQRCVQRYVSNHYDRIVLTMPKGERDQIRSMATLTGESLNGYIMDAVHNRMKAEGVVMPD